jgi:hypothetical protein
MGIKIAVVAFNNDFTKAKIIKQTDDLYLSYNWVDLNSYWSVDENMHGRSGKDIIEGLKTAIQKMTDEGIKVGIRDQSNPDWSYGIDRYQVRISDHERKSIFLYHLQYFLKIAEKYQEHFFISDSCSQIIYHDGKQINIVHENDDDDEDEDDDHDGEENDGE